MDSAEKPVSTSYKTIGCKRGLPREQLLKILILINPKWLSPGRLRNLSDTALLMLIYILSGVQPDTKICDFHVKSKGQLRYSIKYW